MTNMTEFCKPQSAPENLDMMLVKITRGPLYVVHELKLNSWIPEPSI